MQAGRALLPLSLLLGAFLQVNAANFTFNFGAATECDNFPVSWSGGSPPFSLTLAPAFGSQRVMDIPNSSFSGGKGSFQVQMPFPNKQKFIAIMSDASGFGSGGASDLIVTGPQVGNNKCNTTDPGVDFFFELNDALTQCELYNISGYDSAVQPVTIQGIVPGGTTFVLDPPTGPSWYDWPSDAAAGTGIMFVMSDSLGRKGGCSDVRTVAVSGDTSCLSGNSPMSASSAPQATQSSSSTSSTSPSSSSSASPDADNASKKSDTGVIIGGVLASLFGISTLVALGLFFWRRRNRRQKDNYYNGGFGGRSNRRKGRLDSLDLDPAVGMSDPVSPLPDVQPFPYTASHMSDHFGSPSSHNLLTSTHSGSQSQHPSNSQTQYSAFNNPFDEQSEHSSHSRNPSVPGLTASGSSIQDGRYMGTMSSSGRSKASMAGAVNTRPTRFVLHTDIEEAAPADENEEVVELPPQYSELRAPLPSVIDGSQRGSTGTSLYYLDHRRGDSEIRLQPPLQPGPPTPPAGKLFHNS
ncbi:hypothetical protein BC835DRAFT_981480 [Cytidiella melzeri]|nr:hypothetical protein BC835DRAFT_981480 [Cytidiella melzeri]